MSTLTAQTYLSPSEYLVWERKQSFKEDTLSLASSECTLPLHAIYRRVMFNVS